MTLKAFSLSLTAIKFDSVQLIGTVMKSDPPPDPAKILTSRNGLGL